MTKEKKPTTATTSKTKRPVGRPKKSAATTPPLPKSVEKLAAAKKAVKPTAKKPSEKSQATRDMTKAVKGTHARPSTTPALYDAKAAFELSQSQINKLNRKLISQGKTIETLTKVISDQGHEIRRTKKLVGTLVETHNADVNQRIDKAIDSRKPWYKRLSNRRSS
ncbi:hypothetical protein [Mycobacteroides abscessus]|uniref:hypothetical protein n=1 Tax=Mycobacteroides abscessus TaxID=36809 RepID=UPI0012FFF198|nr:hypothetical protein [Mycobacteroides abscessus]